MARLLDTPALRRACSTRVPVTFLRFMVTASMYDLHSLMRLSNSVSGPYRHYVFLPIPVIIQVHMPSLLCLAFTKGPFCKVCLFAALLHSQ